MMKQPRPEIAYCQVLRVCKTGDMQSMRRREMVGLSLLIRRQLSLRTELLTLEQSELLSKRQNLTMKIFWTRV